MNIAHWQTLTETGIITSKVQLSQKESTAAIIKYLAITMVSLIA